MHHYYMPCTQQQERFQGSHQRSSTTQTLFRRCSSLSQDPPSNNVRKIDQQSQWCASQLESQSQTPSLDDSSSPSQQDETSPRTPSSFAIDNLCAIDAEKGQKVTDEPAHFGAYSFLHGDALPSRPKTCARPQPQHTAVPVVITETARRSRVARPTSNLDIGFPAAAHASVTKAPPSVTLNSKCHSRRRACGQSTTLAPPKLKRDTDCTDAIVRLIVCFSTKLVHTIWSDSSTTPRASGAFHGAGVLPLRVFIQETLRRSKTSYSTLQVALFYLILLKPYVGQHPSNQDGRTSGCRALQCGRRMFLTALILASKYLQDRNYSSRAWSKISGLPINEINENERRYLGLIQFNLHMKKETFENWSKIVLTLCKAGESSMNLDLAQESSRSRPRETLDNVSITSDDEARSGSNQWWDQQLKLLSADLIENSGQTELYLASLTQNKSDATIGSDELLASLDTPPSSPDSASDLVTEKVMAKPSEINMDFGGQKFVDFGSSPASVVSIPTQPRLPNLPTPQTTPRFPRTLPMPKGMCQMKSRCKESSRALLGLDKQAVSIANLETCPPPQPRLREHMNSSSSREGSNLANSSYPSGFASSPESMVSDVPSSAPRSRSSSMSSNSSIWWSSAAQQLADETSGRVQGLRKEASQVTSTRQPAEAMVPSSYSFYHAAHTTPRTSGDDQVTCTGSVYTSAPTATANGSQVGSYSNDSDEIDSILASLANDDSSPASKCPAATPSVDEQLVSGTVTTRKHKRDRSSISEDVLQYQVRSLLWEESSAVEVIESLGSSQPQRKQLQYPVKEWACLKQPISNDLHTKRFAMCHDVESYSTDLASRYLREDLTMVG